MQGDISTLLLQVHSLVSLVQTQQFDMNQVKNKIDTMHTLILGEAQNLYESGQPL